MTNFERPPAANAAEFMAMARAMAGLSSPAAKVVSLLLRLPWRVGIRATVRGSSSDLRRSGGSGEELGHDQCWSPEPSSKAEPVAGSCFTAAAEYADSGPDAPRGDDTLRVDLQRRLRGGRRVRPGCAAVRLGGPRHQWRRVGGRGDVEPVPVGRLVIPAQDLATAEARSTERHVGRLAFTPWNTPDAFRPLGNLNRARRAVYDASAAHRAGQRFVAEVRPGRRRSTPWRVGLSACSDAAFRGIA